ncbi:MAG: hypothetical protein DRJ97_03615 [Thermoprotei archaeon]|nr:MAG: hypothetical protein DRJ97_03615 [Thermoprotei archaeon]
MKVNVLAFASPLHPEREWRRRLEEALSSLREAGLKFEDVRVVTSRGVAAQATSAIVSGVKGTIGIILTGGTSKIAAMALKDCVKPLVLVALHEHNALPSALETTAMLRRELCPRLTFIEGESWAQGIAEYLRRASERRQQLKSKLALFGGAPTLGPNEAGFDDLNSKLGVKVVEEELKEMAAEMKRVRNEQVLKVATKLGCVEERVKEPIRLYLASKRILDREGYDGALYNCFSLLHELRTTPCLANSLLNDEGYVAVCEAEVQSTAASLIATKLLKAKFFISNISAVSSSEIILAHCTAPISMGRSVEFKDHFESGLPVSLDVELSKEPVTLFNLNKDLAELFVVKGAIVESRLNLERMCRTQVKVKVEGVSEVLRNVPGGHLVLVYGDRVEELTRIAEELNLSVRLYK